MQTKKIRISVLIVILLAGILYGIGPSVYADAGGRTLEVDVTRYSNFSVYDAKPTEDGGYILAGMSDNLSTLLKTDAMGKELWRQTITVGGMPGFIVTSVLPIGGDAYIYTGMSVLMLDNSWVGKLTSDRQIAWTRMVNGSLRAMQKTEFNMILLTGHRRSANYDLDVTAVLLDNTGADVFLTSFGMDGDQYAHSSLRAFDGTYLLGGSTGQNDGTSRKDALLTQIMSMGIKINQKTYGSPEWSETIEAMAPVNDLGYILTGNVVKGSTQEIMLLKLDAKLNQEWLRTYPVGNHGVDVRLAREGGYLVSGTDANQRMLLMKTDAAGNMQWFHQLSDKGTGSNTRQNTDGSYSFIGGDVDGGWYTLQVAAPEHVTVDDQANRLVGNTADMEFSTNAGATYASFADEPTPIFPGNEEVWVRYRKDMEQGYGAGKVKVLNFTANAANAADARLYNLDIDGEAVTGFDPELEEYTVEVPRERSAVSVTASTYEPAANLVINGQFVQSTEAVNVAVAPPGVEVVIMVTAADGISTRSYTLHLVQEAEPEPEVPGPEVPGPEPENPENPGTPENPPGEPGNPPNPENPENPGSPEEPPVQPENPSGPSVPSSPSSPSGQQTAPSVPVISSVLTGLTVSSGTLEPAFSPDLLRYQLALPADISSVTLQWPVTGQIIVVNGSTVQQGNITLVHLKSGSNPVNIMVKGTDGEARNYFIDVVRGEKGLAENEASPPVTGIDLSAIEGQPDWADRAMVLAAQMGIIEGYGDGGYQPQGALTRLEYAVMLQRLLQLPVSEEVKKKSEFADQEKIPAWGIEAASAMREAGIIQGYPDGRYAPEQGVTRAEMSAIMVRAFQLKSSSKSVDFTFLPFNDMDQVAFWARPYVQTLQQFGVVKGRADHTFAPQDKLTRAEAVMMLLRVQQIVMLD